MHVSLLGPSIKYFTLFLANFDPPSTCHTLSHIPGPPKSRSHISNPLIFCRPSTKEPGQRPPVQILSQLFTGVFCCGSFVWKVLSGVVLIRFPCCKNTSVKTES